jgi:hypothetical protein
MTPLLAISVQSLAVTIALIAMLELAKCTDWIGTRRKIRSLGLPLIASVPTQTPRLPVLSRGRSLSRCPFLSSASRCNPGHRPDRRSITTKTSSSL